MLESIVQAHRVKKTFGKQQVLYDIDLEVKQGSVLALLGPNGGRKDDHGQDPHHTAKA
jgi:tungstate transport system ATP-binding protein